MAGKPTVYVVTQKALDVPIRAIFSKRAKAERYAFEERKLCDIRMDVEAWQVDAAVEPEEGE